MLSEAGYADGFSMTMITNTDDAEVNTAAGAAVDQLARIGIRIHLKSISGMEYWAEMATKKYPAGAVSYGLYGVLPGEAYRLYKLPISAVWNPFASVDSDIDKAYGALTTSSESTFKKRATQFNKVMTAKAWYIPIVNTPQFVYSKGVDLGSPDPMGSFAVSSWKPQG